MCIYYWKVVESKLQLKNKIFELPGISKEKWNDDVCFPIRPIPQVQIKEINQCWLATIRNTNTINLALRIKKDKNQMVWYW